MFTGQTPMQEVLSAFPGAALALFQRYRIGSRDKYGFRSDEPLETVLRRYLVFDVEGVVDYLVTCLEVERRLLLAPAEVEGFLGQPGVLVDARSPEEHELVRIPGSRLLDGSLAEEHKQKDAPLVFYCHTGLMAGAAARYFDNLGFRSLGIVRGGIDAWSREHDPGLPRYGSGDDVTGQCRILAAREQARFTLDTTWFPAHPVSLAREHAGSLPWLEQLFGELPDLQVVVGSRALVTACRSTSHHWGEAAPIVWKALRQIDGPVSPQAGTSRSEQDLAQAVLDLLTEKVNPALSDHNGFAELTGLKDLMAEIRMGGGCQGCASVKITVDNQIAAVLHRHLPELMGVRDVSRHDQATQSYQGGEASPRIE